MSKYLGEEQHGYWWLHANNSLQYTKNCSEMNPEKFFNNWACIEWWLVRCELDWYRMNKEYQELRDRAIPNIAA